MINNLPNFNFADKVIYSVEAVILKAIHLIKQESSPDPEEMIAAATQHLQEENEELKDYMIPEKLIYNRQDYTYLCPKCGEKLSQELVEKYKIKCCVECGKRLFRVNNPA
ncbi:MAG: hypothetical protein ACI4DN_02735 [Lachnospiraceae bacterium]